MSARNRLVVFEELLESWRNWTERRRTAGVDDPGIGTLWICIDDLGAAIQKAKRAHPTGGTE